MDYAELKAQVVKHKQYFKNTTLSIKKFVAASNTMAVHFVSESIDIRDNSRKHRLVCGIWQVNQHKQIDRVWAVVTPYYAQ